MKEVTDLIPLRVACLLRQAHLLPPRPPFQLHAGINIICNIFGLPRCKHLYRQPILIMPRSAKHCTLISLLAHQYSSHDTLLHRYHIRSGPQPSIQGMDRAGNADHQARPQTAAAVHSLAHHNLPNPSLFPLYQTYAPTPVNLLPIPVLSQQEEQSTSFPPAFTMLTMARHATSSPYSELGFASQTPTILHHHHSPSPIPLSSHPALPLRDVSSGHRISAPSPLHGRNTNTTRASAQAHHSAPELGLSEVIQILMGMPLGSTKAYPYYRYIFERPEEHRLTKDDINLPEVKQFYTKCGNVCQNSSRYSPSSFANLLPSAATIPTGRLL